MEYRLICRFSTSDGSTVSHSFKFANEEATAQQVDTLMTAAITNGTIFQKVPIAKKEAYLEATQKSTFEIA